MEISEENAQKLSRIRSPPKVALVTLICRVLGLEKDFLDLASDDVLGRKLRDIKLL
ncbi:MAG: hypothetical protein OXC03_00105 [Flavobacteriaceae bacterium]|nr:hypothetical protein [Flavobacteriaceae bacterium]